MLRICLICLSIAFSHTANANSISNTQKIEEQGFNNFWLNIGLIAGIHSFGLTSAGIESFGSTIEFNYKLNDKYVITVGERTMNTLSCVFTCNEENIGDLLRTNPKYALFGKHVFNQRTTLSAGLGNTTQTHYLVGSSWKEDRIAGLVKLSMYTKWHKLLGYGAITAIVTRDESSIGLEVGFGFGH